MAQPPADVHAILDLSQPWCTAVLFRPSTADQRLICNHPPRGELLMWIESIYWYYPAYWPHHDDVQGRHYRSCITGRRTWFKSLIFSNLFL